MRVFSVDFRGDKIDLQIDHDGGYEPDTNAHEVDWHFVGLTPEQQDELNMTPEEEQSIYDQVYAVLADGSDDE